jgi:hypothetical protein
MRSLAAMVSVSIVATLAPDAALADSTSCAAGCDHLISLAKKMADEMKKSGAKVTVSKEDPRPKCLADCGAGRLDPQCLVESENVLDAGDCSLAPGQDPDVAALVVAASRGKLERMAALIKKGVDVNAASDGKRPLAQAASAGNAAAVKVLLKAGAKVNLAEQTSVSPLQWAVIQDHVPVIKALIAAGADVNYKNSYGETPLSEAHDHPDIIKLLRAAGAK